MLQQIRLSFVRLRIARCAGVMLEPTDDQPFTLAKALSPQDYH